MVASYSLSFLNKMIYFSSHITYYVYIDHISSFNVKGYLPSSHVNKFYVSIAGTKD